MNERVVYEYTPDSIRKHAWLSLQFCFFVLLCSTTIWLLLGIPAILLFAWYTLVTVLLAVIFPVGVFFVRRKRVAVDSMGIHVVVGGKEKLRISWDAISGLISRESAMGMYSIRIEASDGKTLHLTHAYPLSEIREALTRRLSDSCPVSSKYLKCDFRNLYVMTAVVFILMYTIALGTWLLVVLMETLLPI